MLTTSTGCKYIFMVMMIINLIVVHKIWANLLKQLLKRKILKDKMLPGQGKLTMCPQRHEKALGKVDPAVSVL